MPTYFYDTNALLECQDKAFNAPFYVSVVTLQELENIKTSANKSDDVKFRARKVAHLLDKYDGKYTVCMDILKPTERVEIEHTPDANICFAAYMVSRRNQDVVFCTNDVCCKAIARNVFGLNTVSVDDGVKSAFYKGYVEYTGDENGFNEYLENLDKSTLFCNEYLIFNNSSSGKTTEMRFDGNDWTGLKLPSSNYIKGKNALQRCAIDLLMNKDISTVAVLGTYGSGKTYLSMQMALYHVLEKGNQAKILGVRSPEGEGKEVGFLAGSFDEKTDLFFNPLSQQLKGGEFEANSLRQRGVIETTIPYYMKGLTLDNSICCVDEAEDLSESEIRLVGTRIGDNSRIFFSGDYGQSIHNKSLSNPLVKMCDELKGCSNFGCIFLDEDVRSETSKMFANLFK